MAIFLSKILSISVIFFRFFFFFFFVFILRKTKHLISGKRKDKLSYRAHENTPIQIPQVLLPSGFPKDLNIC